MRDDWFSSGNHNKRGLPHVAMCILCKINIAMIKRTKMRHKSQVLMSIWALTLTDLIIGRVNRCTAVHFLIFKFTEHKFI